MVDFKQQNFYVFSSLLEVHALHGLYGHYIPICSTRLTNKNDLIAIHHLQHCIK